MKNLLATIPFIIVSCSPAHAAPAFLVGEEVSGLNKICYYESAYGRHAITVRSTSLCPLTIQV